jgi:ABC-type antimicrobial peptide transport system permease subunit
MNRDYLRRSVNAYLRSLANENYLRKLARDSFDTLLNQDYLRQIISRELKGAISRFLDGYMNARVVVCDTLAVCGVLKSREHGRTRTESVILPIGTAALFSSGGLSDDPTSMFTALQSGSLFAPPGEADARNYPRVTLNVDPATSHQTLSDTIKTMGYRTFSFAEQFDEITKFFWYFDLALGLIGLIALVTASLGIINTMVMSILERTREIGVLKSLGADERDIRRLFLVESGAIGAIGAMAGIFLGWVITRAASFIARWYMVREGIDEMELFALPWWLILIALSFGVLVSLAAGFYPASRAARVDPVAALRND